MFLAQTNNSKANLVALCRFSSMYLPGGPGAEAGVGALEAVRVGMGVPLPLEEAFPLSSSMPARGGLH